MIQLISNTKPPCLKPGDEFTTIAISSAIEDETSLLKGIKVFEEWGLVCRPQEICTRKWNGLAGDDQTRSQELQPDPPSPLLACARGGWGAARLLELPHSWQKGWVLGFSDVSSILLARLASGFHGCIHGPLVTTISNEPEWSKERLHSLLFGNPIEPLKGEPWGRGLATGPIVVANLTVASHLIGSCFLPDLKGAILVLEDVGEAPYRIDRMLTHWRLAGILHQIAGLGMGSFHDCLQDDENHLENELQLRKVLKDRTIDLGIPIVGDLPIGHRQGNAALPLGWKAELDGDKGILSILP